MSITSRSYQPYLDTPKVSAFLEQTYPPNDKNPNWLRSRWEYMVYSVRSGEEESLTPIGIWENGNELVGMVNFEEALGEAYFQVHPGYPQLKADMVRYAEKALHKVAHGKKHLTLYINTFDKALEDLAAAAGYVKATNSPQVTTRCDFASCSLAYTLPPGFKVTDRRGSNDLKQINHVLWRGFNHEGPPPEKYVAGRGDVEKAPLFRPDLVIMIEAPDGHFVSYCGLWYEEVLKLVYVEPVATDPDNRRHGFGKAAVLEGLGRAEQLGATRAIVGSDQTFYRAIGFQPLFTYFPWRKEWV